MKAEREEQYKPKPVITILDDEDEKLLKKNENEILPPIETEPIESDSDDEVHFDDVSQPEPSRTPPRPHHHHRRHHRHHQNHHRDGENDEELIEIDRESSKEKRPSPVIIRATTPVQAMLPHHDEDSRMSLVSEPEKTSSSE